MRKIGMIAILISLVLSLAVSAGAMSPIKGDLAMAFSSGTTSTGITTHTGSDIQRYQTVVTPSVVSGFTSTIHVYLVGLSPQEASTTASQCAGYGTKNLVYRVYSGTKKPGDLLINLTKTSASGNEGTGNRNASSQSSSHGSSRRGSSYHSTNSSSGSSSSSLDATSVYLRYSFTISRVAGDGQLDILPSLNVPVGGSDSAMINERSSDNNRSSRSYYSSTTRRGGYSGGSSYSGSSSSSSSSYRSPKIEQAMMTDRIADRSQNNLAALIVDAITQAALSGQIPGAIFETYQSPQQTTSVPQGTNVSAPLR